MPCMLQSSSNGVERSGFTLVEMLLIAPVVILVLGGFIALMVSMVGNTLITRERSLLTFEVQNSLNRIEQDVRVSTKFPTTTGPVASPQGSDDGTAAFNSSSALILNMLATNKNPEDTTRQLVFYANQPNPCGSTETANKVFTLQVIYYLKNGSLWRRTILPVYNLNATPDINTVCKSPWQRNSCSPGYAPSPNCETSDSEITKNVSTFTFSYYLNAQDANALTPSQSDTASAVKVYLANTKTAASQAVGDSGSVLVTRFNTIK